MGLNLNASLLPNRQGVVRFIRTLRDMFYPGFFSRKSAADKSAEEAKELYLRYISPDKAKMAEFFAEAEKLKTVFEKDIKITYDSDPACDSYEEIISSYPGFTATFYYRIAHILYLQDLRLCARLIGEQAHFLTGIDINPGAVIGESFFIDHGTGIVIGETSIVGHHVKMYQGVTLGGISLARGHLMKGEKRHPTIGNYVTIYSGASILGGNVVIGDNVVIGSNVYLVDSVPPNTKVVLAKPQLILLPKKTPPKEE